jgi:predicted transcriptional regulator
MLPCEAAANYIVPMAKANLARKLKKKGLSQRDIAARLNVTESAVSYYLSGKRAKSSKKKFKIAKCKEVCSVCGLCRMGNA